MARCKYCGRAGLFLRVDERGVCRDCATKIYPLIQHHTALIKDALHRMEKSRQPRTVVSQRDIALESLEFLEQEFESKGIRLFDEGTATLRDNIVKAADDILLQLLAEEAKKTDAKAAVADTPKQKASHYKRFLSKIVEFESLMADPSRLVQLKQEVLLKVRENVVRDLILKAQKYEFKGNLKKAKEIYLDALFELKHDDVPDHLQAPLIQEVEAHLRRIESYA